jgi:hypothetical protein
MEITPVLNHLGQRVPDTCERYTVKQNSINGTPYSFRVTHWLKEVPLKMPEVDPDLGDLYIEYFLEDHPDWMIKHRMVYCTQEEATHVSGYGVSGNISRISDINLSNEYVPWSDERIKEERERATGWVGERVDGVYRRKDARKLTPAERGQVERLTKQLKDNSDRSKSRLGSRRTEALDRCLRGYQRERMRLLLKRTAIFAKIYAA